MKAGVVLIILLVILALAFFYFGGHGHMWGGEGSMYLLHGGGYLWIVLLIVLGLAAYLILQNVQPRSGADGDSPLDILKKRFARGEINREQFDEMKKKLEE